jgi:hypothetical protein
MFSEIIYVRKETLYERQKEDYSNNNNKPEEGDHGELHVVVPEERLHDPYCPLFHL